MSSPSEKRDLWVTLRRNPKNAKPLHWTILDLLDNSEAFLPEWCSSEKLSQAVLHTGEWIEWNTHNDDPHKYRVGQKSVYSRESESTVYFVWLFINNCILFHTSNCKPSFGPACVGHASCFVLCHCGRRPRWLGHWLQGHRCSEKEWVLCQPGMLARLLPA